MDTTDKNGDEGKEKVAGDQVEIVTNLQKQIADMGKVLEEQKTANGDLLKKISENQEMYTNPDFIDFLDKKKNGGQDGASDKSGDNLDLDAMSRSELAEHITKGLSGIMTDFAKKSDEQFGVQATRLGKLSNMVDVELTKIKHPEFAELLSTEEGTETFLKAADENTTQGAEKLWEGINDKQIVADKVAADKVEADAAAELEAFSEKPGAAISTAEGKEMSAQEIAEKAFDASFGTDPHALEGEEAGVIVG